MSQQQARLQQIYGDNHDFVLTNLDRGLEVRMEIPFEEKPRFAAGQDRAAGQQRAA